MNFTDPILAGAARALFVDAWATRQEERGKTGGWSGQDLMNLAPKTPRRAFLDAAMLIGKTEQLNGYGIHSIVGAAWKADGNSDSELIPDSYRENFGHYLAMQALGHGVGWYDDHARITLHWPDREYRVPRIDGYDL